MHRELRCRVKINAFNQPAAGLKSIPSHCDEQIHTAITHIALAHIFCGWISSAPNLSTVILSVRDAFEVLAVCQSPPSPELRRVCVCVCIFVFTSTEWFHVLRIHSQTKHHRGFLEPTYIEGSIYSIGYMHIFTIYKPLDILTVCRVWTWYRFLRVWFAQTAGPSVLNMVIAIVTRARQ